MKLKCPICDNELEVDVDLVEDQHVRCAMCSRVFEYTPEKPKECSRREDESIRWPIVVAAVVLILLMIILITYSGTERTDRIGASESNQSPRLTAQEQLQKTVTLQRAQNSEAKQVWKYDGDPLDNYLLGTYKFTQHENFVMSSFLGFQTMQIGYTSKGRIAGICLKTKDSARLSVSYTDYMVDHMIKRCNLKYGPIDWTIDTRVTGGKYAKGRCFHFGKLDKVFVLLPSGSGGMTADLISVRAQREDDGYEYPEGFYDNL